MQDYSPDRQEQGLYSFQFDGSSSEKSELSQETLRQVPGPSAISSTNLTDQSQEPKIESVSNVFTSGVALKRRVYQ